MSNEFQAQLEWATPRGLYLHPSIERKSVNGIYGMYAKAAIQSDTLLASFPSDQLLDSSQGPFGNADKTRSLNWLHAAVREITDTKSSFSGIFAGFERLEDMRGYSYYFCTEDELKTLQQMSPILYNWVQELKQQAYEIINKILDVEPSYERDDVLKVYLNFRSRGFNPFGIVPVLDQFNHSDLKGGPNKHEEGKLCAYAKVDYQAGDQVYISYGAKDLYQHAIHYNYFDEEGPHFVDFGRKAVHTATGQAGIKKIHHLKKFFKVNELSINGIRAFNFHEPHMLLIEGTPSIDLVKALTEICRAQLNMRVSDQALKVHAARYFQQLLDEQLSLNKVDTLKEQDIPPRLIRFYKLLKKERAMLIENRNKLEPLLSGAKKSVRT